MLFAPGIFQFSVYAVHMAALTITLTCLDLTTHLLLRLLVIHFLSVNHIISQNIYKEPSEYCLSQSLKKYNQFNMF